MSGICGIAAPDNASIERRALESMVGAVEKRGPDGSHVWFGGQAALGHALLATTPASLLETLPLTHAESGCTITADVRLDNREALITALGLSGAGNDVGDGGLILRAYLKWGEDCTDHLIGDFAFAIWDPRRNALFAARDHMGIRPLYYGRGRNGSIVLATTCEAILASGLFERSINERRVADFLGGLVLADHVSTFFEGIDRLPPAHRLTVQNGETLIERYWTLQPPPPLHLRDDREYAEAFLAVFEEAVRCRLENAGGLGAMLSGGLDSASVAGVAGRILGAEGAPPLPTFSAVGPDPADCVETAMARLAATMPGLDPSFVDFTKLEPYQDDLRRLTEGIAEPFDGLMTLPRAVYLCARRKGTKIILHGVGGDIALGRGTRTARLLRSGHILRAIAEHRGERDFWGAEYQPWSAFGRAARTALVPDWLRSLKRALSGGPDTSALEFDLIRPEFAERIGLTRRLLETRPDAGRLSLPDAEERAQACMDPMFLSGVERFNRVAADAGLEARDPFMDIRLLQFCCSLPSQQRSNGNWSKVIMRRAMEGILPDDLRWRRGKSHLGPDFTRALNRRWSREWDNTIGATSTHLQHWIRDEELRAASDWNRLDLIRYQDYKILYLALWLARYV